MRIKLATTCFVISTLLAPVAGYTADTSERHMDRKHPLTWVKDSVITTKIKTKLGADYPGSLKHIQVDTDQDGIVWLSGTANNQDKINQAIVIARNAKGVKSVWSDLEVKNDR